MKRWIISDTHFGHDNIKIYCGRPDDHTERIIKNWQDCVSDDDITYHLGDVSIAMKAEQVRDILTTIRGKKILVRGNHDSGWSDTKWMNAGFDFVCDSIGVGDILLTHEPTFISGNLYRYNVHGHLHNIGYQGVKAFGGTYEYFNDGKHFLYSPELQMYTPKRLDKFMNW